MFIRGLGFILFIFFNQNMLSQGMLTGNVRFNMDFYDRDSAIAAVGENYEYNKNSANVWLQTIYSDQAKGIEASIRFDGNYNSILQNPPNATSFYGIGNWYIKKKIDDKLDVSVGYLYEQYGNGTALRTFEERSLGIDNAIFGIRAKYKLNEKLSIRGIAGTQKYRLEFFGAFVKGMNAEYSHDFNDSFGFNVGSSIVNRTYSKEERAALDNAIQDKYYFPVNYNTYVGDIYTTVRYRNFTAYVEGAYKTKGAILNALTPELYQNKAGYMIYGSLTYSKPKLGITFQGRQVENFLFNSTQTQDPLFDRLNNRKLSFLAPINKQHSLRLPARFQIAPNELGETGASLDLTYSLTKKIAINFNASIIDTIGWKDPYYRELTGDVLFKKLLGGKLDQHVGVQYIYYNQRRYLGGTEPTDIVSYTGFTETIYRFNRKRSMRLELQYQHAAKDLGQSVFALVEFNIAPSWSFSVSDLYNFKPNPHYEVQKAYQNSHHFWNVFASYTKSTTRFTLMYTKQLAGIVCTGGVCRFEPAFSGLRAQMTASF
jgi:hypothetical protein